jgi:uncharacterized protein (TIGR02444 family)
LDPGAFWEFSLAYYSRESVARACLSLQDRRGADVNILLLCCWLATLGRRIEEPGLRAAMTAVEAWRREVMEPLRAARRAVAADFPELPESDRQSIKQGILAIELESEHAAQAKIVGTIATLPDATDPGTPRGTAGDALEAYLALVIAAPDARDAEDLAALLEQL